MPVLPVVLDYKRLKEYVFENRRSHFYNTALTNYKDFLTHSDGVYPEEIIERQRPNEPLEVKQFRKEIWEPITKPTFTRVLSSINKIRRSSDWAITYPEDAAALSKIKEGETLEDYCEKKFPFFESVTNWVFSVLIKPYLIDSNGAILVQPLKFDVDENEYLQPYPYIFSCIDVFDFVEGDYAVLNIVEGSTLKRDGKAFYFVNRQVIQKWEQYTAKEFQVTMEYQHGMDILPVFKIGGLIAKTEGTNFLYESRISGILPNLNECVAEYTDLQAAKRLHIYPERWQYTQHECATCKGSTVINNPAYVAGSTMPRQIACNTCGGLGYLASTPYSMMLVKPAQAGMQPLPTPPAGFIEKDVEIVKIMDESWRRHIYDALSAINFQFLDQSPLNQSGLAKEVDKEELNNTVHSIAEDLVKIMDKFYYLCAGYRYKNLYSLDQIKESLPSIAVPDHFDLLSSQFMQEEISKAKAAKLNPTIVNNMEIEFAGKRFINTPEIKDRLALVLKLDPLPNVTEDEKGGMLANKGITQVNYVISSNIQQFVQRAIDENEQFDEMELADQMDILRGYAQEQIDTEQKEAEKRMQTAMERAGALANPEGTATDEDDLVIEQEDPELILNNA